MGVPADSPGARKGPEGCRGLDPPHHRRSQGRGGGGGSSLESAPYGQRVVSSSPDCVAKFFKIFMTQLTSAGDFMTTRF